MAQDDKLYTVNEVSIARNKIPDSWPGVTDMFKI